MSVTDLPILEDNTDPYFAPTFTRHEGGGVTISHWPGRFLMSRELWEQLPGPSETDAPVRFVDGATTIEIRVINGTARYAIEGGAGDGRAFWFRRTPDTDPTKAIKGERT